MADEFTERDILVHPGPPDHEMCPLTRLEVRVFFGQTRPRAYRNLSDEEYLKAIAGEVLEDMTHWSVNRFSLDVDAPTGLRGLGAWRHPLRIWADFQALRTKVRTLAEFNAMAERAAFSAADLVRDVIVPRTDSLGAIHIQGLVYPVEPPDYLNAPTATASDEKTAWPEWGLGQDEKLSAFFVGVAVLCVLAVFAVFFVAFKTL
jgi:hypothetical protein